MEQIQLTGPQGPKPKQTSVSRVGVYVFLVSAAIFFCIPLYVMLITSLKGMPEIRLGELLRYRATQVLRLGSKLGVKRALVSNAMVFKRGFGTR